MAESGLSSEDLDLLRRALEPLNRILSLQSMPARESLNDRAELAASHNSDQSNYCSTCSVQTCTGLAPPRVVE